MGLRIPHKLQESEGQHSGAKLKIHNYVGWRKKKVIVKLAFK